MSQWTEIVNYTYIAARSTSDAITIGSCLAVRWRIQVIVLFVGQLVCAFAVSTYRYQYSAGLRGYFDRHPLSVCIRLVGLNLNIVVHLNWPESTHSTITTLRNTIPRNSKKLQLLPPYNKCTNHSESGPNSPHTT